MTSLRALLQRRLLLGLSALSAVLGLGLFLVTRHVLVLQFDEGLEAKARFLSMLVKLDDHARIEFELEEAPLPEFVRAEQAEYFVLRHAGGREVARSASLGAAALPSAPPGPLRFFDLRLPDGRPGRAAALRFVARRESERTPAVAAPEMSLVLARERAGLDRALVRLGLALAAAALALAGGGALVVAGALARGLRPLGQVAERAAAIDARSLDARFPTERMPAELRPICERLNDLLDRLAAAFDRERRFSADVAHELRTPLAELRTAAEVALRWPDDRGDGVLRDVLESATQMEHLVTALLALARCEGGRQPVERAPLDLAALVRDAWAPLAPAAEARGLSFRVQGPEAAPAASDRALLGAVLSNLLGNATEYATTGTTVTCTIARDGAAWRLEIANRQGHLAAADLPHLFEPFWRKDESRTGGAHSGLGLALVAAYARLLDTEVTAHLPAPDELLVALRVR